MFWVTCKVLFRKNKTTALIYGAFTLCQIVCKNDLIVSYNYYKNVKCYKAHLNK